MRRRDELGALRVGPGRTEKPQHRLGGLRVETGVELVDEERRSLVQRPEGEAEHDQQTPRAGAFQIQIEIDRFSVPAAVGEFDGGPPAADHERLEFGRHVSPLSHCRQDVPLERFGFVRVLGFLSSITDDPRADPPEEVDRARARLPLGQMKGCRHARNVAGANTLDRLKVSEHPGQPFVPVLGGRRQVQAVGPGQVGDDGVAPLQLAPESEFAAFALEQRPAAGAGEVVQPFGFEGVVGRLEAVVVAHAVDDEIELETRRLPGASGVEPERLARNPAAGFAPGLGKQHRPPHGRDRLHEVALAGGVGAVDHGRRRHRPLRRGGAGDQPLVPVLQGRRRERQFLEVADREMVGNAEAQQHGGFSAFPAIDRP